MLEDTGTYLVCRTKKNIEFDTTFNDAVGVAFRHFLKLHTSVKETSIEEIRGLTT